MDWMSSLPPQIRERLQGRPGGLQGGQPGGFGGRGRRDGIEGNRFITPPPGVEGNRFITPVPGEEPWRGWTPPLGREQPTGPFDWNAWVRNKFGSQGATPTGPTNWADVARGRFAPMPQMLTPSAQYMNQMGPTAQQQYQGYAQATMGWLPEETMWRQQMIAPPGGQGINVNWR